MIENTYVQGPKSNSSHRFSIRALSRNLESAVRRNHAILRQQLVQFKDILQ